MSQTVEFEYGIGETVEIVPLRFTDGGIRKVLGTVCAAFVHHAGTSFDVDYRNKYGEQTRNSFPEGQLAKIPPKEHLSPAPTPTFPRVIWQGKVKNAEFRIVQTSPDSCTPEVLSLGDAMGVQQWCVTHWEGAWVRDAALALADCQARAEAALVRMRATSGSDQNP